MLPRNDVIALERAEIEAMESLYRAAPSAVAVETGLSIDSVADARVLGASRIDVLALNRVLGLGLDERPSDAALAAVDAACRRAGAPRVFVPVAPLDTTADLGPRLEARGLRRYNNWIRLRRATIEIPSAPASPFVVQQIDTTAAPVFAALVANAFGYPPAISALVGGAIGAPGWRHYLAFDNGRPIATAAMFVSGRAAWFGFAATAAEARGRGAQTALVIRRLHDAANAGCAWVSVETAEDSLQKDAPSFRNLRRLGFDVAYARPNYLWTA